MAVGADDTAAVRSCTGIAEGDPRLRRPWRPGRRDVGRSQRGTPVASGCGVRAVGDREVPAQADQRGDEQNDGHHGNPDAVPAGHPEAGALGGEQHGDAQ